MLFLAVILTEALLGGDLGGGLGGDQLVVILAEALVLLGSCFGGSLACEANHASTACEGSEHGELVA